MENKQKMALQHSAIGMDEKVLLNFCNDREEATNVKDKIKLYKKIRSSWWSTFEDGLANISKEIGAPELILA